MSATKRTDRPSRRFLRAYDDLVAGTATAAAPPPEPASEEITPNPVPELAPTSRTNENVNIDTETPISVAVDSPLPIVEAAEFTRQECIPLDSVPLPTPSIVEPEDAHTRTDLDNNSVISMAIEREGPDVSPAPPSEYALWTPQPIFGSSKPAEPEHEVTSLVSFPSPLMEFRILPRSSSLPSATGDPPSTFTSNVQMPKVPLTPPQAPPRNSSLKTRVRKDSGVATSAPRTSSDSANAVSSPTSSSAAGSDKLSRAGSTRSWSSSRSRRSFKTVSQPPSSSKAVLEIIEEDDEMAAATDSEATLTAPSSPVAASRKGSPSPPPPPPVEKDIPVIPVRITSLPSELGGKAIKLPGGTDWIDLPAGLPDSSKFFVTDHRAIKASQMGKMQRNAAPVIDKALPRLDTNKLLVHGVDWIDVEQPMSDRDKFVFNSSRVIKAAEQAKEAKAAAKQSPKWPAVQPANLLGKPTKFVINAKTA